MYNYNFNNNSIVKESISFAEKKWVVCATNMIFGGYSLQVRCGYISQSKTYCVIDAESFFNKIRSALKNNKTFPCDYDGILSWGNTLPYYDNGVLEIIVDKTVFNSEEEAKTYLLNGEGEQINFMREVNGKLEKFHKPFFDSIIQQICNIKD